jgi:hypothetical protein
MKLRAGLVILGTAALSGCGSKPLTSSELQHQATRVCALASRQTDRISTPASPAGTDAFLKRGIAVMRPELTGLRRLRPPSDVADVYSTSLDAFATKLSDLEHTVRALTGGEEPMIAMKTLQQKLGPIESQENGAWQALEIPACLNR